MHQQRRPFAATITITLTRLASSAAIQQQQEQSVHEITSVISKHSWQKESYNGAYYLRNLGRFCTL